MRTTSLMKIITLLVVAVLGCAGVAACSKSQAADVGCELTAPAIKAIALALKVNPETAVGSIALDALGIVVSAVCKEALAKDTTPKTPDIFLKSDPNVPNQVRIPSGGGECDHGAMLYTSVASANLNTAKPPITSCEFSINVRDAFLRSGSRTPSDIDAYSPVKNQWYSMHCEGDYPVVCRGGDRAGVYIY